MLIITKASLQVWIFTKTVLLNVIHTVTVSTLFVVGRGAALHTFPVSSTCVVYCVSRNFDVELTLVIW